MMAGGLNCGGDQAGVPVVCRPPRAESARATRPPRHPPHPPAHHCNRCQPRAPRDACPLARGVAGVAQMSRRGGRGKGATPHGVTAPAAAPAPAASGPGFVRLVIDSPEMATGTMFNSLRDMEGRLDSSDFDIEVEVSASMWAAVTAAAKAWSGRGAWDTAVAGSKGGGGGGGGGGSRGRGGAANGMGSGGPVRTSGVTPPRTTRTAATLAADGGGGGGTGGGGGGEGVDDFLRAHMGIECVMVDGTPVYLATEERPRRTPMPTMTFTLLSHSGRGDRVLRMSVKRALPLSSAHGGSLFRLVTWFSAPGLPAAVVYSPPFRVLAKQGKPGSELKTVHPPRYQRLDPKRAVGMSLIAAAGRLCYHTLEAGEDVSLPVPPDTAQRGLALALQVVRAAGMETEGVADGLEHLGREGGGVQVNASALQSYVATCAASAPMFVPGLEPMVEHGGGDTKPMAGWLVGGEEGKHDGIMPQRSAKRLRMDGDVASAEADGTTALAAAASHGHGQQHGGMVETPRLTPTLVAMQTGGVGRGHGTPSAGTVTEDSASHPHPTISPLLNTHSLNERPPLLGPPAPHPALHRTDTGDSLPPMLLGMPPTLGYPGGGEGEGMLMPALSTGSMRRNGMGKAGATNGGPPTGEPQNGMGLTSWSTSTMDMASNRSSFTHTGAARGGMPPTFLRPPALDHRQEAGAELTRSISAGGPGTPLFGSSMDRGVSLLPDMTVPLSKTPSDEYGSPSDVTLCGPSPAIERTRPLTRVPSTTSDGGSGHTGGGPGVHPDGTNSFTPLLTSTTSAALVVRPTRAGHATTVLPLQPAESLSRYLAIDAGDGGQGGGGGGGGGGTRPRRPSVMQPSPYKR